MRNFWLDKKRQNEETLSFADEQSKAIFWNNRKANCCSKNPNLEYRKKGVDPNNDERLQGHGLESDPRPSSYSVVAQEGLAGDVEVLLKNYWRWQFPHNDEATLGLVRRLQRYINNGQWHMIEDRIMGRANSVGRPITQEFSDKLKHYIVKLQTEETLRQQKLYEKLVEQVQPAEYATLSDRFEHEAKKKRFNKVEMTPGLRTMFGPRPYEDNPIDYGFDSFTECYHRYFGTGNHLYILVKDYDEDKVLEVGCRQVHPRLMVEDMSKAAKDFRIIVIDVEMGGRGVWVPKENKECTSE